MEAPTLSTILGELQNIEGISTSGSGLAGTNIGTTSSIQTTSCAQVGDLRMHLSPSGLSSLPKEKVIEMITKYYDLIMIYYSEASNLKPDSTADFSTAKVGLGLISSSSQSWMTKADASALIQSMFFMTLILIRAKAKDITSIRNYLHGARYRSTASALIAQGNRDSVFSLNPLNKGVIDFLNILRNSDSDMEGVYYHIIHLYLGAGEKLKSTHTKTFPTYAAADAWRRSRDDEWKQVPRTFLALLQGGCIIHLRFNGLMILRFFEDIVRKSSLNYYQCCQMLCVKSMQALLTQIVGVYLMNNL